MLRLPSTCISKKNRRQLKKLLKLTKIVDGRIAECNFYSSSIEKAITFSE